jgi:hypothetical protein
VPNERLRARLGDHLSDCKPLKTSEGSENDPFAGRQIAGTGLREQWLRGARDWCWRIARFLLADPNVVAALLLHYALRSNVRDDCRCEL